MSTASRHAIVERVEPLSPTVRTYHLSVEGREPFSYQPGQWVSLQVPLAQGIAERVYSIASAPRAAPAFELCVKQGSGEQGDQYLGALGPGSRVEFSGPGGGFVLQQPMERQAIFVAQGTGIAPLRAMLQAAVEASNGHRLTLLFGARTGSDLLYRDEWESLERRHENLLFLPTLSKPHRSWTGRRGYVQEQTGALLKDQPNADVYICGEPDMVREVRQQCREWKLPEERVHFENYA